MAPPWAPTSGMARSRSLPGLMALGTDMPSRRSHARTSTLVYRLDAPADLAPGPAPSEKAATLAKELENPERLFARKTPPATPLPLEEEEAKLPANMQIPRLAPAWLKHDKQVLRFYTYFQENVGERHDENARFRNCVLSYFLEDGSICVSEPKVENSGMPQGLLVKRHRVPRADGRGFMGPGDLRCGDEVEIYAKRFHVTACDRFTRWFYEQNGVDVGEDEESPIDKFTSDYAFRRSAEKSEFPMPRSVKEGKILNELYLGGARTNDKLQQFLENDRKVLRFYGYWDDNTRYGSRFYFVIHFFLSNNTVEINENHSRNDGRAPFPVFYGRNELPKKRIGSEVPGLLLPDEEIYLPKDLIVGQFINVLGRDVFLYKCDDFTQSFYRQYMNLEQGELDVSEPPPEHTALHYPPPSGLGSEEDSLASCLNLVPKPPKQDLVRLMTLSGEVLRYEAKLVNGQPEDEDRRFIVGVFPADDTNAVWEIQMRNSGFVGGKFAERGKRENPDTGSMFVMQDFYVGALVNIKQHPLLILRADEHTLAFMEQRPEEFCVSHVGLICRKLLPLVGHPEITSAETIGPDRLLDLARDDAGVELVDHEVITLLRCLGGVAEAPTIKTADLVALLEDLKQRGF